MLFLQGEKVCKMTRFPKIFLLVLFLVGHVLASEMAVKIGDGTVDEAVAKNDSVWVQKFDEKFSLRFLCDYTLWSVWNTAYGNEALVSNSPVSLGLGFPTMIFLRCLEFRGISRGISR